MANDLVTRKMPAYSAYVGAFLSVVKMDDMARLELPTPAEVETIRRELKNALVPCTLSKAAELAQILIGSYPRHMVDDAAIYSRAIVSVLEDFPVAVATHAVDVVTKKCRFVPTRAEVYDACDELYRQMTWAQFVADRIEGERERRTRENQEAKQRALDRLAWKEKHGDKSPLDVLREKGLYSEKGMQDGEEISDQGSDATRGAGRLRNRGGRDGRRDDHREDQGGDCD